VSFDSKTLDQCHAIGGTHTISEFRHGWQNSGSRKRINGSNTIHNFMGHRPFSITGKYIHPYPSMAGDRMSFHDDLKGIVPDDALLHLTRHFEVIGDIHVYRAWPAC
jgi:hypothetical protein